MENRSPLVVVCTGWRSTRISRMVSKTAPVVGPVITTSSPTLSEPLSISNSATPMPLKYFTPRATYSLRRVALEP